MPIKRSFGVTLLLWTVLLLSAWGAIRLFASLRWWNVLLEFKSSLSPLYLSITGAGWVVAGGVLLWSMWVGKPRTYQAILISVLIWLIEYWIERVAFQSSRANLPFALSGSVLIIIIALISALHKSTIDFFTRSEEYEQPNKNPDSE